VIFELALVALLQPQAIDLVKPLTFGGLTYDVKVLDPDSKYGGQGASICDASRIVISSGSTLWTLDGKFLRPLKVPERSISSQALPQHGRAGPIVLAQYPNEVVLESLRNGKWVNFLVAKPGGRSIHCSVDEIAVGVEVSPSGLSAAAYRSGKVRLLPGPRGNSEALGVQGGVACGYVTVRGKIAAAQWRLDSVTGPEMLPTPPGLVATEAVQTDGRLTVGVGSTIAPVIEGQGLRTDRGVLWDHAKLVPWRFEKGFERTSVVPRAVLDGLVIGYTQTSHFESQQAFVAKRDRVFLLPDIHIGISRIHFYDVKDQDRHGTLLCDAQLVQPGKANHPIACLLRPTRPAR